MSNLNGRTLTTDLNNNPNGDIKHLAKAAHYLAVTAGLLLDSPLKGSISYKLRDGKFEVEGVTTRGESLVVTTPIVDGAISPTSMTIDTDRGTVNIFKTLRRKPARAAIALSTLYRNIERAYLEYIVFGALMTEVEALQFDLEVAQAALVAVKESEGNAFKDLALIGAQAEVKTLKKKIKKARADAGFAG